jgi:hypothetical protein
MNSKRKTIKKKVSQKKKINKRKQKYSLKGGLNDKPKRNDQLYFNALAKQATNANHQYKYTLPYNQMYQSLADIRREEALKQQQLENNHVKMWENFRTNMTNQFKQPNEI